MREIINYVFLNCSFQSLLILIQPIQILYNRNRANKAGYTLVELRRKICTKILSTFKCHLKVV